MLDIMISRGTIWYVGIERPVPEVAIYVKNHFNFTEIDCVDLNWDAEFESIFIQVNLPNRKLLVGEIYRIPNTSEKNSIDRYGKVIDTLTNSYPTHIIIIGTNQNFDYMKINNNNNISLLLCYRQADKDNSFVSNIYVKCSPYELSNAISGIIETDISDSHMPVFLFTGQKEKH